MSSINDPQKQDAPPGESDTVGKGVFSNIITEIPPSPQNEQDEHDLASQTARLALDEHTTNAVPPHNPSTTTSLGGESDSTTMDENVNPKPAHATTAPQPESEPADKNQADEAIILAKLKEGDKILLSESNATLATADDLDSPRFTTYLKLHNDMMISKSTITSDPTEQSKLHHHASHVARTMLTSHEKHDDLPLMMQVHACVVLGCSDEDDCCERMQEALFLVRCALLEGDVSKKEGEETIEACERVLGMEEQRERAAAGIDDEGSEGSEGDDDDKDKDVGEDGVESGGDGIERNDALP